MRDLIELTFTILKKEWNEGDRKCVMHDVASEALTTPGAVMMFPNKASEEGFPADIDEVSASIKFGQLCFYMHLSDENKPMSYNAKEEADVICQLMGRDWYARHCAYFEPLLQAEIMGVPKSKLH